ncbi:hypothetical protein D3C71_1705690 [compost metagenome]
MLQHHPLHTHVIFGVAPVAQRIHIAQMQAAFETLSDIGDSAGDLAGDKGFTTAWRFMVKQNAVTGIHAIGFAVVHGDPVGIHLGHRIGRTRIKRGGFALRDLLHQAIQLRGRGLIKLSLLRQAIHPNRFKNTQCADGIHICGIFR